MRDMTKAPGLLPRAGDHGRGPCSQRQEKKIARRAGETLPSPGKGGARHCWLPSCPGASLARALAVVVCLLALLAPRQAQAAATLSVRCGDLLLSSTHTWVMTGSRGEGYVYCLNHDKLTPTEDLQLTYGGGGDLVLDYLVYHGYRGDNSLNLWGYQGEVPAASFTQFAIWEYMTPGEASFSSSTQEKIDAFISKAKAWAAAGGIGPERGFSTIWKSPDGSYQNIVSGKVSGSIVISKSSTVSGLTSLPGSAYSLEGATYVVYSDSACTHKVATAKTDSSGKATVSDLTPGTYWVREQGASRGFAVDPGTYKVEVSPGGTATVKSGEKPIGAWGMRVVAKTSDETGAPLAGAVFAVDYYAGSYSADPLPDSPTRTWLLVSDDSGSVVVDESHRTGGDALFRDSSGQVFVPLGTIRVREQTPPSGYLPLEGDVAVVILGDAGSCTTEALEKAGLPASVTNSPARADIRLTKVDEDGAALPGVPFLLTNTKTGEAHVLVTDAEGVIDTSALPRTEPANQSDEALLEDGALDEGALDASSCVWFSLDPDDPSQPVEGRGALPLGTYRLEELRCSAYPTKRLVTLEVEVGEAGAVVDAGEILDKELPTLATTLLDEKEHHTCLPTGTITLVDHVLAEHLLVGESYRIEGELVSARDGEPVTDAEGEPIRSSVEFVAEEESQMVDVVFEVDAGTLAGETIVCFEELFENDETIAVHADIEDRSQSVGFATIGTTAKDEATQGHEGCAEESVVVVDTVAFSGLSPCDEYALVATLADSSTGEPLTEGGKPVTARLVFSPEEATGTVDVRIVCDADTVRGKDVVVFESLFVGEDLVASHEDPTDEGQTVSYPAVSTSASDGQDGDSTLEHEPRQVVVDLVRYENLVPGETYALVCTLVDKGTGEPVVDASGEKVEARVEFIPETPSGEHEVRVVVDCERLAGDDLVCFEELYHGEVLVGAHRDVSDEGQTVTVRPISRLPRTGDPVAGAAAAGLVFVGFALILVSRFLNGLHR